MLQLGLLASHRGSNVRAVVEACQDGRLKAEPALIISNNAQARVLRFAQEAGVPHAWIGGKAHAKPETRDLAMLAALREHGVNLLLLLGYMRLLGPKTVDAYRGRILNVHPALLPRHGGKGMYGMAVHEAVLSAGEAKTGVTVHHVDELYDHGDTVAQCEVPVLRDDTPELLAARVLKREHSFLVETLTSIASGEIHLGNR